MTRLMSRVWLLLFNKPHVTLSTYSCFFPTSIDIFFTTVMLFLWLCTTVENIGFLQAVQDVGHGSYSDGILQWKLNV